MNIYTVRKATQGLSNYLLSHGVKTGVAIAYDSRIKSDLFAKESAAVLPPMESRPLCIPGFLLRLPFPLLSGI